MRKIKNFVKYPLKLNLSAYSNDSEYELYGVLIHEGFSVNCGHYYSYIKGFDNKWYCMNDSLVSFVSESNILKQNPYILFYKKIIKKSFKDILDIPVKSNNEIQESSKKSKIASYKDNLKSESNLKNLSVKDNLTGNSKYLLVNKSISYTNIYDKDAFYNKISIEKILSRKRSILGKHYSILKNKNNFKKLIDNKINSKANLPLVNNNNYNNNNNNNNKILSIKDDENVSTSKYMNNNCNKKSNKINLNILKSKVINNWYKDNKLEKDSSNIQIEERNAFIKYNNKVTNSKLNYKDNYDIEYDLGKLKKVKTKQEFINVKTKDNPFYIVQKSKAKRLKTK